MGLALAITVAVVTVVLSVLIVFANGMSDAPSVQGISPWPTFCTGMFIAAVLAVTHYVPIHW